MQTTHWIRRIPWTVVVCAVALMLIGLSGIARGDARIAGGDLYERQLIWVLISIPAMFAATIVPYRSLRGLSVPLFCISLVLLVVVFFLPPTNGARQWIPLGFAKFQPSELAKFAFIMTTAQFLMYDRNYRKLRGLVVPFVLALLPIGLILKEPDLGTSLVFLPVLFAMLFAAGARPRHLALVVFLGIATLPVLWMGMNAEQKSRVVSVFAQVDGGRAPPGDGYHLHQSKQVLALGGPVGSELAGPRLDDPAAYHLPADRTDFIYCLVGERWGLWGALVTLSIYVILFARGFLIANATREPFGRLVAVGIVTLLATQVTINTAMTVGLMPITGLTLPLMSYGGSSLLSTCLAIGLLLNVGMRPGYELTPEPFRFARGQ